MFVLFDEICAETLGIPVQEYIEKVEKLSEGKQHVIINMLLDCRLKPEKLLQIKRIFNSL